jgi:hypothetical protein
MHASSQGYVRVEMHGEQAGNDFVFSNPSMDSGNFTVLTHNKLAFRLQNEFGLITVVNSNGFPDRKNQ